MRITRLYTGPDGESHFEDLDIPLMDAGPIGYLSQAFPATSFILRETSGDYDYTWHTAPRRQAIIMLEGAVDVEIGDGTVRRFGPGDIVFAEDTTGRGHRSRAVDEQPRRSLFVTFD
jgi:uncharacterized cupin superfamily protein